jgi:hypothetical protein
MHFPSLLPLDLPGFHLSSAQTHGCYWQTRKRALHFPIKPTLFAVCILEINSQP